MKEQTFPAWRQAPVEQTIAMQPCENGARWSHFGGTHTHAQKTATFILVDSSRTQHANANVEVDRVIHVIWDYTFVNPGQTICKES